MKLLLEFAGSIALTLYCICALLVAIFVYYRIDLLGQSALVG